MRTSIIIHGHFYQPPRENPATGLVPKQICQERWSDWNEKIDESCYKANCRSRYLGPYGKIRTITNNYESISWNFGPTLLSWLDRNDPSVVECLRKADRSSLEALGHGNAIAQGFAHSILPLDNQRDRILQIAWGIEDFKHRFGRMPEGFWCPECAINPDVVDCLAEAGIKFVVLSPWQAKAIEGEDGKMAPLDGRPAPFDRPYKIRGRRGSLAAFFYESNIASAVSFGHILRDADALHSRLVEVKRSNGGPPLIHWATDGEIYGHHEPFGDMALAALIKKINDGDEFELTNYGAYLEKHPATLEAELLEGDDKLGTSWSCSHGVARWFRDCGCSTGAKQGWNQKWRTPLREALAKLEGRLYSAYEKTVSKIIAPGPSQAPPAEGMGQAPEGFAASGPAFKLLLGYGKVAVGAVDAECYLKPFRLGGDERILVAKLLLGMRDILCSFASCGWFFNDLGGAEPRQNIAFGVEAIRLFGELLPPEVEEDFLDGLGRARSNVPAYKTGREMALCAKSALPGEDEAAAAAFLSHLANPRTAIRRYGRFRVSPGEEAGSYRLLDTLTTERTRRLVRLDLPGKRLEITSGKQVRGCLFAELPERLKDQLVLEIDNAVCVHAKNLVSEIGNSITILALVSGKFAIPMHDADYALALGSLKQFFNAPLGRIMDEWPAKAQAVATITSLIAHRAPSLTNELLKRLLSGALDQLASEIRASGPRAAELEFALQLLRMSRAAGLEPDTTALQDAVYFCTSLIRRKAAGGSPAEGPMDGESPGRLARALAAELNFEL